jgi:hypothetical protein
VTGRRSALAVVAPFRRLSFGGRSLGPGSVFVGDPATVAGLVERGVCVPLVEGKQAGRPGRAGARR